MTFEADLKKGKTIEDMFGRFLKGRLRKNEVTPPPDGYFPGWDLKADNETYEIKFQSDAERIGAFYFERTCSEKPSGLWATKADWFVNVYRTKKDGDTAHYVMARTHHLREFIEKHEAYFPLKTGIGDGGRTTGHVVGIRYMSGSSIPGIVELTEPWPLP